MAGFSEFFPGISIAEDGLREAVSAALRRAIPLIKNHVYGDWPQYESRHDWLVINFSDYPAWDFGVAPYYESRNAGWVRLAMIDSHTGDFIVMADGFKCYRLDTEDEVVDHILNYIGDVIEDHEKFQSRREES